MKIVVCSYNTCIRTSQTALALLDAGHDVVLLSHTSSALRQFNERIPVTATFITPEQMIAAIKAFAPDIVYWHDRPHQYPSILVDAKLGIPLVHDLHDIFSIMVPGAVDAEETPHEKKSILGADGLVFVSESNRRSVEKRYGQLPPSAVVRSGVYSKCYPNVRGPHIGAAVWGGGLYAEPPQSPRFYIDQREIVLRFGAVGQSAVICHAPTDTPDVPDQYRKAGAVVAGMYGYQHLVFEYSRYDFGWYGQTEDHAQIHGTIPNKLFEYIAGGLPVCVINAEEAGKFVVDNDLGVHIRRPEDIVYVRDELERLRPVVWEKRWEFTRERECTCLPGLFEQAIEYHGRRRGHEKA